MRKAGLANLVRISAVHHAQLQALPRGTRVLCPPLSWTLGTPGTSWAAGGLRLVRGDAQLGGRWDTCGEVGHGNSVARQRKAMAKGRQRQRQGFKPEHPAPGT